MEWNELFTSSHGECMIDGKDDQHEPHGIYET